MTTQTNETFYLDLHTTGVGYLNRARVVKPTGGQKFKPFTSVSVAAMYGSSDDVQYSYYDVTCVGKETAELIQKYMTQINDQNTKVTCHFAIGDAYAASYTKTDGTHGASSKGRLLSLYQIKIDGEVVYKKEKQETDNDNTETANDSAPHQNIGHDSVDSITDSIADSQQASSNTTTEANVAAAI